MISTLFLTALSINLSQAIISEHMYVYFIFIIF